MFGYPDSYIGRTHVSYKHRSFKFIKHDIMRRHPGLSVEQVNRRAKAIREAFKIQTAVWERLFSQLPIKRREELLGIIRNGKDIYIKTTKAQALRQRLNLMEVRY